MTADTLRKDRGPRSSDPTWSDPDTRDGAGLHAHYRTYRRRQALDFLAMVPREGVRPLYRAALTWAEGRMGDDAAAPGEIELLLRYCGACLPLPPFDVWLRDRRENPAAHLDLGDADAAAPVGVSVTAEVRSLDAKGRSWYATLSLRRSRGAWGGRITFHTGRDGRSYRTGEIFREDRADDVRRRFLELDERTLAAFLRSTLP